MRMILATALAAVCAGAAHAALTSQITFQSSYGSTSGGEFVVEYANFAFAPSSLTGGTTFETFCIERNETIAYNRTYFVDFSDAARAGGAGGPNPDPLDARTAYLYTNFQAGTLAGYDYGVGAARTRSANALQNVIWYLEEELTNVNSGLNATEQALAGQFLAAANSSGWTDIGNVRIMNVYDTAEATGNRQDQLVMVPVPGAAMLGVVGLALTSRLRRLE